MTKDITLEQKALSIIDQVKDRLPTVGSQEDLDRANAALKHCRSLKDEISGVFDPIVTKANQAHKEAIAQRRKLQEPVERAIAYLKSTMGTYIAEEQRKRREEEAKAEAARLEAKRQADEAARAAAEAEAEGLGAQADAIMEEALELDQKAVDLGNARPTTPEPKAEGIHTRTVWEFEIEDITQIPLDFMEPDLKAIGAFVRAKKDKAKLAGVRIYSRTVVVGRK